MDGQWKEIEKAPEGLDVAGLGQVPVEVSGNWYVKHPHTGAVLEHPGVAAPGNIIKQDPDNPFMSLVTAQLAAGTGQPMVDLLDSLTALGHQISLLANYAPAPAPAPMQAVITAGQDAATKFSAALAYAQQLAAANATLTKNASAAGSAGPAAPSSSSGMSKTAVGAISGVGGLLAGATVGFLAARSMPAKPSHEIPVRLPSGRTTHVHE